ncbi:MAG TPA: hypothetical protein VIE66_20345 [Methylocella sp.]|jgi:hypothetical protein
MSRAVELAQDPKDPAIRRAPHGEKGVATFRTFSGAATSRDRIKVISAMLNHIVAFTFGLPLGFPHLYGWHRL